jgi:hypothetical protein
VAISYQNKPILTGTRSSPHRLWHLDLPSASHQANAAIGSASPADLVAFAHAAMFLPALSTLAQAQSNGYLSNFPGLSSAVLCKYPPQSAPMIKGHLDQVCQNTQSTKMTPPEKDDAFLPALDRNHSSFAHHCLAAERAIHTFKNHFIAGLFSLDKDFPLHLWDRLLPQALLTLNLLQGSCTNPKLSAYAQLNGHFDFNRTPIAPPGIRVLVHEKPSNRGTWAPHALDGWYVSPALESYHCHRVWMWDTRATRICDTITWMPTRPTMPSPSMYKVIEEHLREIIHLLRKPMSNPHLQPLPESHLHAIETLASIFPTKPTEPVDMPKQDATPNVPLTSEPNSQPPTAPLPRVPPAPTAPLPRVPESTLLHL